MTGFNWRWYHLFHPRVWVDVLFPRIPRLSQWHSRVERRHPAPWGPVLSDRSRDTVLMRRVKRGAKKV